VRVKKIFLGLFIVFLLSSTTTPFISWADSRLDQINKQIKDLNAQINQAKAKKTEISRKIEQTKAEQKKVSQDITILTQSISETNQKIAKLEEQINATITKAQDAAQALEQAEERVKERDQLLKTRVRLMYKKSDVDYLEVLLDATSLADFLSRLRALELIVESDQNILLANKRDRDTIKSKKEEIDQTLANLKKLFAEVQDLKDSLVVQQKEKTARISSLQKLAEDLNEASQEEEELLIKLAAQQAKLQEEKTQILLKNGIVTFAWPTTTNYITSPFGMRVHPITGQYTGHKGIDIGAGYGSDIRASATGVVIVAQYISGYGNTIIINHGNGMWTLYAHIRNGGIFVNVGQTVKQGEKIAEVGSTGRSTGPHLHFEIRKNEVPEDPLKYLPK